MMDRWVKNAFRNLIGLVLAGLVLGMIHSNADLLWAALIALIITRSETPAWLVNPSPRLRLVFAWLQTVISLYLIALALYAPVRLALWHTLGGVYRAGPIWALAAAGWTMLAALAWRQVLLVERLERTIPGKMG